MSGPKLFMPGETVTIIHKDSRSFYHHTRIHLGGVRCNIMAYEDFNHTTACYNLIVHTEYGDRVRIVESDLSGYASRLANSRQGQMGRSQIEFERAFAKSIPAVNLKGDVKEDSPVSKIADSVRETIKEDDKSILPKYKGRRNRKLSINFDI